MNTIKLKKIPLSTNMMDAEQISAYIEENNFIKMQDGELIIQGDAQINGKLMFYKNIEQNYVNSAGQVVSCSSTGAYSQAFGQQTSALATYSHTEGKVNSAGCEGHGDGGWCSHIEGNLNFDYDGKMNHIEGRNNRVCVITPSKAGKGSYCNHIQGFANVVSSDNYGQGASFVGGICAQANHENTFVWSGVPLNGPDGKPANPNTTVIWDPVEPRYADNGKGTFNINPLDGERGFFITSSSLYDLIERHLAPIYKIFDPSWNGNIYDTISEGKKYVEQKDISETFQYMTDGSTSNADLIKVIKLAPHVTDIGQYCFSRCTKLQEVNLENNKLSSIGNSAFQYSTITNVTIPDTVIKVDAYSFRGSYLSSIEFGDNVTQFNADYMFQNCSKLKTVKLPKNVTLYSSQWNIMKYTFSGCTMIEIVDANNNSSITKQNIKDNAKNAHTFDNIKRTVLIKCCDGDMNLTVDVSNNYTFEEL